MEEEGGGGRRAGKKGRAPVPPKIRTAGHRANREKEKDGGVRGKGMMVVCK